MYLLEMAKTKAMGIGSMCVLLVVAIVLLPMLVRYIDRSESHFSMSGFQNMPDLKVPDSVSSFKDVSYIPDKNTDYLCRSPNSSGVPCTEAYFCDGVTQQCVDKYVGMKKDVVGYYS